MIKVAEWRTPGTKGLNVGKLFNGRKVALAVQPLKLCIIYMICELVYIYNENT